MYRPVLLFLGFTTLSTALPQTRPPTSTTSTTTALYTSPTPFLTPSTTQQNSQDQVIHDIIDTVTCTDPESGTTTTYESHDIDIDGTTATNNNNNNNNNINPQLRKEHTHKLLKRGNCLPRAQQQYLDYYEDPPSLDQMLRPSTGGAGGGGGNINAPIGIHYSQFGNVNRLDADSAGAGGVGDRRGSHISNIENLVAEPSVEGSIGQGVAVNDRNNGDGGDGDGGGGGNGIEEDHDFDLRMDEFGTGLEPDALGFERGIVEVRHGVGGGINGGGGRGGGGGRARLLAGRFGDVVHDALEEYAAANRRQEEEEEEKEDTSPLQRAHSRPEEPNPINLDDSQYSVIDQETIDEMRGAVMDELASGYGNIGIDIGDYGDGENGAGGDLEGFPDTTDTPLQSVLTGQENEFPSVGEETMRLFWGDGRAPDPDFGWPPRGV
ncbi:hypothetical protein TWF703_010216 [Orbilia oligospora]|uniref:Uncharacterized protein n=1 Tax=Orbilia oligospora TaxID=2813651 RepID=A0A7C8P069_ORBOL|nr:hypothetical protein TWF703_010216 [Orbilia oligospora]